MKVYGIRTCDTVRSAIRALSAAGYVPELVDMRESGIEEAELQRFFAAFGAALVNKRSATWRGLSEAERAYDPVRQILANPTLMKRPVIEDGTALTLGWDKSVQTQWLGNPA